MPEYEIYGKVVRTPFIKSESNVAKLFNMMKINGADVAIFIYGHSSTEAKGNLKINVPDFSYSMEFFDNEPFERTHILYPFKSVEIEIEPSRIFDKKKKLGLNEKGYKFARFHYHQIPNNTGIHIVSDKSKKETIAGMSAEAKDFEPLKRFTLAMEELGFTKLKEENRKREIISLV